jgi:CopA family copper-resistance protein
MKGDPDLTRRRFVGWAASSALLAGAVSPLQAKPALPRRCETTELCGTEFHLTIEKSVVNITGENAVATTVNGMLGGPVLRWREGDEVTIHVTNRLDEPSSIHWHGIILPAAMDGVPDISFDGISPGATFTYRFRVVQSGTFWYHSHSGFQEQTGIYGAIVIEPREADPYSCERDYVLLLSDWSDEDPHRIYRKLKLSSDYYNFNQRTVGDFFAEAAEKGLLNAWNERRMWNEMRMMDRDIADVTGYTYTYLVNGRSPSSPWRALFESGEKVRLRVINAAAMTFFDLRIPGLKLTVVAADGNNVQPVSVDEFRIGVAETYDLIVEPSAERAYTIFAQAIDRSGYAAATLSADSAMSAEIPRMDPPPVLTHGDMGMKMEGMDHAAMDHEMHVSDTPAIPVTPLPSAEGVQTSMRAEDPRYRLDDPGIGLRNNGRRVLRYSDLKSLRSTSRDGEPDREIILHLTGNMERYIWSINGIKYADAEPLLFYYGERLRITFVNDTMMNHPMHLHGMWSDLESGDNGHLPRKHTVIVQPGSKISIRVTVDARGAWAFHCHLLYHMAGMFRKVVVIEGGA